MYEVRSFTSAGVQDKIIYGARIEFTDELGSAGYVKVTLPRSRAIEQGLSHRTEVAVFLNGVELDGSRAFLVETTGNPSSGEDIRGEASDAQWGGRTLHAGTKGINTYPTVFPVLTGAPKNHIFTDKTPGFILKTLLDAARSRGAASDIAYTTWTATTDSNGVGWAKALKLEYKPGTDLKTIIENLIRLGAIEFRYSGREFKIYNADTFGMDWTTGANPICLYRGREVADSPYSESSDEVVNALLVMGDDGIMVEKVDTDSVALYGRREGTLSQGGTKDLGMLNFLGDTTLSTSARLRGEYTVRILPLDTGPQPFTDYRVGDWILYDRVAGQPPEKFRVRQISVTSDGDSQNVVVTLNDKFAELDLRTSKKVEGIIGGAAMEGSTPVSSPDVDTLDPSPPTGVGSSSEDYTDSSGATRALAISTWNSPTTNVDGSPLTDLAGFDVEHRTVRRVTYAANTAWYPATTDVRLQARWDRRGKDTVNAWVGADGGASVRAANGDDWFFWSDTNWGRMAQDGSLIEWNSMPRSSITKSDPTTLNELRSYTGRRNIVEDGIALFTDAAATWSRSNCTPVIEPGEGGINGLWLKATATAANANPYAHRLLPQGSIVGGRKYLFAAKIDKGNATDPRFYVAWYNSAGAQIGIADRIIPDADGWCRGVYTAPDQATTCYVMLALGTSVVGTWARISHIGAFQTDHALQTWAPQTHSEIFYNEVVNPDGVTGVAATAADALLFTNISPNPSSETVDTVWSVYGGATKARTASGTAWVGSNVMRITNGTAAAGLAAMHYPVPISADTGYVARARVRGTAGKTLYGTLANYNGGSGTGGGGGASPTVTLSDQWQEIVFPASTGAATANNLGLQFLRSGTWAVGDYFEVDGVEVYTASPGLPPFYFDGGTTPPAGYKSMWTGAVDNSPSTLYATSEVDKNWVGNPRVYNGLTDWSAYGSGTAVSRTTSQVVGQSGARGPIPTLVGASALSTWFTDLAAAGSKSVGIGYVGDSTSESTGSESNPDLSDRAIERLQALLRKYSNVSGVPISPPGYYGASAYIPAWYIHGGPIDWTFETADPVKYPLVSPQSGAGAGGRIRNISAGHKAYFTATFDRVRIFYGKWGYGRKLRILIDGVEQAVVDTYGATSTTAYWTSPSLTRGEHTVVCEFVSYDGFTNADGSPDGSVSINGAEIWDGDYSKGVRVYDLSGSGKAAYDVATSAREMDDDFKNRPLSLIVIELGFNDFGRTPPWAGGARTAANFKADVQTIIAGARSRGYTGAFLLVGQWQASQLVPGTSGETQANFRAKLAEIANADSKVAYLDLSTVMPDTVGDTTGMYSDGLHPSTKGMERVAECLFWALTPQSTASEASAQVLTSGSTALAGVQVQTPTHSTPWAVGTPYSAGAWVLAPAGTQLVLRVLAAGTAGGTYPFTATGKWQFVTSPLLTVASGATSAPYFIVRTDSAQRVAFWVGRAIISSAPVSSYFDGEISRDGHTAKWTGARWLSQSTLSTTQPANVYGQMSGGTAQYFFDASEYVQGQGSVCVHSTVAGTYQAVSHSFTPIAAGKYITVKAMVKTNYQLNGVLARPRNSGTYIGSTTQTPVTAAPGEWFEVQWSGVGSLDANQFIVVGYGPVPVGGKMWVSEATVVANDNPYYYRGTPFHGGQSGQGVDTEWVGTPNASRSKGTFYNSSSAPSLPQGGALFSPVAAGGNISEYVWVTGAVKVPTADRALVFCNGMRNRALRNGGGWNFQRNGTIYAAEMDLTNTSLVRWIQWFDDPNIQWGEAAVYDGSYLYIYGGGGSDYFGTTHVMRVPAADPLGGTRQFWNGSTWSATAGSSVPISVSSASGGFSAVRKFNGKWIAMHVGGYMNWIDGYEAPAPEGPWTRIGAVHVFSEKSDFSMKYSARFHPQMDTAEDGIVISYSEAGVNGNTVYGVKFARGPKGAVSPQFTADDAWWRHPSVETSPDYYSPLNPGWAYQVRVRSRDQNDRVSPWVTGAPILLTGDVTPPPKPAKPVATSFFRGARIEVSGLTESGAAQPLDFQRLTVHQSTSADFEPSDANLIDTLTTRGGIVISSGLTWGVAYFWKVVAWDYSGNRSEASEPATAQAERLSDPDLPEKLIDGAKHIKDQSLSVQNFSVGAFGNTIVPNGNMEEHRSGEELPTGWIKGLPSGTYTDWETAAQFSTDYSNPVAGSKSIKITPTAVSSRQLFSPSFPLTPGDVYYVKAKIRTSRKLGADFIEIGLAMGETLKDVGGFGSAKSASASAGSSDGSISAPVTVEGQVEVPDLFGDGGGTAMHFGSFYLRAGYDGNSPYDVWVDDVEVRQIVGTAALANASINRAKIRYLAVDDARISSVGVGKLVAGELWADITVSARIMTAKTGQRVEINRMGLFGYNGADSTPVTEVRASDGGLVSRWIRTNTEGTRIEMGTYGAAMGANAALMSFHPGVQDPSTSVYPSTSQKWLFPPAFGFGGSDRRGQTPGLAIHAGSYSADYHDMYGMNMFSVDQMGGIVGVTGIKLVGGESSQGAPIHLNAGGPRGVIDIRAGSYNSQGSDRSRILLTPWTKGVGGLPSSMERSRIDLNFGVLSLMPAGTWGEYSIQFSDAWGNAPYNHLLFTAGSGGFRFATSAQSNALIVSPGGVLRGSGWNAAVKLQPEGSDLYYCSFFTDGQRVSVRVYDDARNVVLDREIKP